MDLFAASAFYDATCINQVALMQGVPLESLSHLPGLRYRVVHVEPQCGLFVIVAEETLPTGMKETRDVFYVLGGVTFRAPEFYCVVQTRLRNVAAHLANAYEAFTGYLNKLEQP